MSLSLLNGSETGIAMLDESGNLVLSNRDFYSLTGYEAAEAPELTLPVLWPEAKHVLSSVGGVRGEWRGEAEMTRKDGTAISMSLSVTSSESAYGNGFIVRISSVPEEKISDTPADRASDPDMRRLVHQVRNLLTTISGNLELIDKAVRDRPVRRRIELI